MLTDAQKVAVRRFAGYPAVGDTTANDTRDSVYGWVPPGVLQTLAHRLDSLSVQEEEVLTGTYLDNLATLETAILTAASNLDSQQAGPWVRNPNEIRERKALFNDWRRRMCAFLGIEPGPDLGDGTLRIVRA